MPVKKESSGRRSVEAEVEVPGTPEEVWAAIATGPGISAWFVPATVDERVGGETVSHFAPDGSMDSVATITEWQPPHRFTAETSEGPGTVATEWIVEAKAGGTCTVRVVHSWFAESDDWDSQFEGHAYGWLSFFKILRLYLEHFRGQESRLVQLAAQSTQGVAATFDRLMGPLGITRDAQERAAASTAEAPPLAGKAVEVLEGPEGFGVLVRLSEPAPGIAHLIGIPMGGPVHVSMRFYLYGDEAVTRAPRVEETWGAWLAGRFADAAGGGPQAGEA